MENSTTGLEIAVVGMAGQFPGADNVRDFWDLLRNGKEGLSSFTPDELKSSGVSEDSFKQDNYVPVKGIINNPFHFAADFFGINHSDALRMDPQIRLMIESCWQALSHAGIEAEDYTGKVGIYAGASSQWSWFNELNTNFSSAAEQFHVAALNDPSFCTRISWLLNLKGPSVTLQTACSTSLVSIHMACQALQAGECDVALAGGVSVTHPHKSGYHWQEGMINSPDGKTRVFDERACGTVFSNGVGVVALKRLEDAISSGDKIFAVVKGSAINNDGSDKISFTAPSELGQQAVIEDALEYAEVDAAQISFIETHGTGTSLGDPIEVAALKGVFSQNNSIALGSVKSNVGHCDAAAGVLSFIKVVLCTYFKTLVPTLNYQRPNPKLELESSPFYVNTETKPWDNQHGFVRLAGVSAFGVGGTNAHVIVQEYKDSENPLCEALEYKALADRKEFCPSTPEKKIEKSVTKSERSPIKKSELLYELLDIVKDYFANSTISPNDDFFEMGASSLDITQLHSKINETYGLSLKLSDFYSFTSCEKLTRYICGNLSDRNEGSYVPPLKNNTVCTSSSSASEYPKHAVAVIGLSGRFPGSENIDAYWKNILDGQEGITFFSEEELLASGIPEAMLKMKNYIKAKGVLNQSHAFDSDAFMYTSRESQYMDPQFRLLHEATWQVLDDAGYNNPQYRPVTGLFASCGSNHAWLEKIKNEVVDPTEQFGVALFNDREFLTTRIAYNLNLTGPAVTVQSACSSSALAITMACQSLFSSQCDLALAGGVSVTTPDKSGYLYAQGMVNSADGHCRPFTTEASGTVFSDGLGMVALKRLDDALRDNDHIYSVISGFGVNNDGHEKTGYTAPNAVGQANCIQQALHMAEVDSDHVEFVEAHGTATLIGDEIEIEGLKSGIGEGDTPCLLGSVKSNIGHTNTASGIASFIKATLALKHMMLPMSCHVTDVVPPSLADSRFQLIDRSMQWKSEHKIRTAGVSSFGIGGTNVHITLQSIDTQNLRHNHRAELVVLSSKSNQGLAQSADKLRQALQNSALSELNLTDLSYTLQLGRGEFDIRTVMVVKDASSLDDSLSRIAEGKLSYSEVPATQPGVVFMFPGQGAQYIAMAEGLYNELPSFKRIIDECHSVLLRDFDIDLLALLYSEGNVETRSSDLQNTRITQPIVFSISYALAKSLGSMGINANAMIGHSIGEYVAATISGVMTLREALNLVAARGRIMQMCHPGAMLSVTASREEVEAFLIDNVTLATINSPNSCVVAGPEDDVRKVQEALTNNSYRCSLLKTSHAFHTSMMKPGVEEFRTELEKVEFKEPNVPFLSNVTGSWISSEEVCSVEYWIDHLCEPVEFHLGVETCLKQLDLNVFVEVGPGRTLSTFVKQIAGSESDISVFNMLRHPLEDVSDWSCFLGVVGELWTKGVVIDWRALYQEVEVGRMSIPGYQFTNTIPMEAGKSLVDESPKIESYISKNTMDEWLYAEAWQQIGLPKVGEVKPSKILCFIPDESWCALLSQQFTEHGQQVRFVLPAKVYCNTNEVFNVVPGDKDHFDKLLMELSHVDFIPDSVIFAWPLNNEMEMVDSWFSAIVFQQAWLQLANSSMFRLLICKTCVAEQALFNGLIKVIAQEVSKCCPRLIELDDHSSREQICEIISQELYADDAHLMVKRTPQERFDKCYKPLERNEAPISSPFKKQGVYLITGGLGDLGLLFAEHLVTHYDAKVILSGRRILPPKNEWNKEVSHQYQADIKKLVELSSIDTGEIDYYTADSSDKEGVSLLLQFINDHYGQLNGVICAAGVTRGDSFKGINQITLDSCQPQFDTKVTSYQVLAELLADEPIDFCLLCSSIASILGGLSFSAYSSVSAFADAFAQYQNQMGQPWVSVNWDGWVFERRDPNDSLGSSLKQLLIEPEEGVAIFEHILHAKLQGQVIVSTGNLNQRFEQWVGCHVIPFSQCTRTTQARSVLDFSQQQVARTIVDIWKDFLKTSAIDDDDNFFEMGANSLDMVQVNKRIVEHIQIDLSVVDMFSYPTANSLAEFIVEQNKVVAHSGSTNTCIASSASEDNYDVSYDEQPEAGEDNIAIIGMAGSFPGAENIHEFWDNLITGKESLSSFTKEELLKEGIEPKLLDCPEYVKSKGVFPNVGEFDAEFFGYTPFEANQMDPQVRAFHTSCWQALQDASLTPKTSDKKIGLYAAASGNLQWLAQAMLTAEGSAGQYSTMTVADKDYMSTCVAYKLNLTGPAMVLSTACSSSLVAVNEAVKSLRAGECDIALAGGVSITLPSKSGYLTEEGMIHSEDGRCRPFDIQASGTVFGDGVGVVVLKPLREAIKDNDSIYATIIGTATNNDGANKVGFTAPSNQGQVDVIRSALSDANISAETLSFIEAHGTGTRLGDPIEFRALRQAFATNNRNYCKLGSVKSNIGHLNSAAGIAGLIKSALALKNKELPASINFARINPEIDIDNSPFVINNQHSKLDDSQGPLRAGISSFGIGGTNSHVILEQAPRGGDCPLEKSESAPLLPFILTARDLRSLETYKKHLKRAIENDISEDQLSSVAFTLMQRESMPYQFVASASNREGLIQRLSAPSHNAIHNSSIGKRKIVFVFPGQGLQYKSMGRELYQSDEVFKHWCDRGFSASQSFCNVDLRALFLEDGEGKHWSNTEYAQPLIFIVEYALVQLLKSWGVQPSMMLGHSLGEYVAAAAANVFSFDDAIAMVCMRGRLMQSTMDASMLSVMCSASITQTMLFGELEIALDNSSELCVVSGSNEEIYAFERLCEQQGIKTRRLNVKRAFHSRYMEPILADYAHEIDDISFSEPSIPIVSNITGETCVKDMLCDPEYWVRQIREPVSFTKALSSLLSDDCTIFLEVGPGKGLTTLVKNHINYQENHICLSLMSNGQTEMSSLVEALGALTALKCDVDWQRYQSSSPQVVKLPPQPLRGKVYPSDIRKLQAVFSNSEAASVEQIVTESVDITDGDKSVTLQGIWQEVLGVPKVGPKDDFISLGGNSLSAVQVVAKAKASGISLDISMLLSQKSIKEIMSKIDEPHLAEKVDENFNTSFEPEKYSTDASCIYASVREKLKYDYGLKCSDVVMRASDGSSLFGFTLADSLSEKILTNQRNYGTLIGLPELMYTFGFSLEKRFFDDLSSYVSYCRRELEEGRLVIITGSDYYLPYSPSYGLSEAEYLQRPLFNDMSIDEELLIPHAFLLVGVTENGYIVFDSSFNYFGEISEQEFAQTVIGFKGIDFMHSHEIYEKSRPWLVMSLNCKGKFPSEEHLVSTTLLKMIHALETRSAISCDENGELHYVGLGAIEQLLENPDLIFSMTLEDRQQFIRQWTSQLSLLERFLQYSHLNGSDNTARIHEASESLTTVKESSCYQERFILTLNELKESITELINNFK
ncbi:beta-ketoacyl synthase N-terminal-like domain-containing protein [Vibrio proteolyticus]